MSNTTVGTALAKVADILSSSDYSDKAVLIIIPNITLADEAATEKYIQDFNTLSTYSFANEPGTLKFGALQPRGEEKSNQIFALEYFDSESSLAKHRTSVPCHAMVSWLVNAKPNGTHPLPIPIPLQIMGYSFIRPTTKNTQAPFIVVTHLELEAEGFSDIEAGIMECGEEVRDIKNVLMFLPGKTAKEIWVITAYRNEQSFQEKGLVKERFTEGEKERGTRTWKEEFLKLKVGYLSRS